MKEFIKFGEFSVKDRVARVGVDEAKAEVRALSERVTELHKKLPLIFVNELPTENIDENSIYLLRLPDGTGTNKYLEYVYINGSWEEWGSIVLEFNIDDYVKKSDLKSEVWQFTLEDGTVIKKKVFAEEYVEE